jgi:hypothetical protein
MIAADPASRLPGRQRPTPTLLRDAAAIWRMTARAARRLPALFAAIYVAWAIVSFLCLRAVVRAHLGLGDNAFGAMTRWDAAILLAANLCLMLATALLAAAIMPAQHALALGAARPGVAQAGWRGLRVFGLLAAMTLGWWVILLGVVVLGLVLWHAIGPVSTLLSLVLTAMGLALLLIATLRLSFAFPALSLGLPAALTEAWTISRFHVGRTVVLMLVAGFPLVPAASILVDTRLDPLGWPAILLRPALQLLGVSLTASLTARLYALYRLPDALRPDRRPSRNRGWRQDPNFKAR